MSEKQARIAHNKPWITGEDRAAVDAVLQSGMIAEGRVTRQFEEAVADYLGLPWGIAASTGTHAIFYALKALGAATGKEVIIPSFVCRAVMDAVTATGARPVFCDTGDDWCINANTAAPLIGPETAAIVFVHSYGISGNVEPVCRLGVPVVEDCCLSFGGRLGERKLGTFGTLCALSFYATKTFTTGEGGMTLGKDPELLKRISAIKNGAESPLEGRDRLPMTDLQAALGLSQLSRYGDFLSRRTQLADYYFEQLSGLPVGLPLNIKDRSIFFRLPLSYPRGYETFAPLFDAEGIDIQRGGVDYPLHLRSGMPPGSLPNTERQFNETFTIPLYPALSEDEAARVAAACRRIFSHHF